MNIERGPNTVRDRRGLRSRSALSARRATLLAALVVAVQLAACSRDQASLQAESCRAMPEFTQNTAGSWINSPPLRRASFQGSVVFVSVWTFACWNCYRSIPWLLDMEKRMGPRGLRVVGIHTPEFDYEKTRANVEKHVRKHGIAHPVMMDNDFAYWRALGNRYWPTFYLVDRKGCIRDTFVGETHRKTAAANGIEQSIGSVLGRP